MYHIYYGGQTYGPYPLEHIESLLASGSIPRDAQYWEAASQAWQPLDALTGARGIPPPVSSLSPASSSSQRPRQSAALPRFSEEPGPGAPVMALPQLPMETSGISPSPAPLPVAGIALAFVLGAAMLILDLQDNYLHVKNPGTWLASCLGGSVTAVLLEYVWNIVGSIALILGAIAASVRLPWANAMMRVVSGTMLWLLFAVLTAVIIEGLGGFVWHPSSLLADMAGLSLAKSIPWAITAFMFRKSAYP
jgi:hypothetical protein